MGIKVLISDVNTRKAFDIFNIVKNYKYNIELCSDSSLFEKIILSLIYLNNVKNCNFNQLKDNSYVFLPIEEKTVLKFYEFIDNKELNNFKYLLPSKKSFELVRDKKKLSKFCLDNDIPTPREYSIEELLKLKQLPCKLIIKPSIGSGSVGIKFIDSYEELLKYKNLDFSKYIIQERLENSKDVKGGFFLFKEGKLISYYGHERIRTYPPEGGVTVFSKCDSNEEIKNIGAKLLEKLNWNGIAMIEFLYDSKSNQYKIIEVNPRAWGSILLSEFCGAKMLKNYINLSLEKEIEFTLINKNTYIRWIFPWDILLYIKSKGKIDNFWKISSDTCYINFTYSNIYRSLMFTLYNILDINKIKKLFTKLINK